MTRLNVTIKLTNIQHNKKTQKSQLAFFCYIVLFNAVFFFTTRCQHKQILYTLY